MTLPFGRLINKYGSNGYPMSFNKEADLTATKGLTASAIGAEVGSIVQPNPIETLQKREHEDLLQEDEDHIISTHQWKSLERKRLPSSKVISQIRRQIVDISAL